MRAAIGQRRWRSLAALGVVFAIIATSCGGGDDDEAQPTPDRTEVPDDTASGTGGSGGTGGARSASLAVRLTEGEAVSAAVATALQVIDGSSLPADRVEEILAALPPLPEDPEDVTDFNRPPNRLPPPRAGETVEAPFPAPEQEPPAEVPEGPLEVIRVQPEGAVSIAPFFTVTFNQPMVPVTTLDQLAAEDVPVVVTPAVEGRWRWLGTKTLRFEVDPSSGIDRLPAATTYTVEIPAGTESATGGTLAEAFSFQFTTPPVEVEILGSVRRETLSLEPLFVISANQKVDPQAVLAVTTIAAGDEERAVRLATAEEIAADEEIAQITSTLLDGRWLVVRPVDPLPFDTRVVVTVGPEIPSAEGPNLGDATARLARNTYGPFVVRRVTCEDPCTPYAYASIELSNTIDPATFDPAAVTVEPPVAGMRVNYFGNQITIEGTSAGRTEYTVMLPDGIVDEFGQPLTVDRALTFTTGNAQPILAGFERPFITLDPLAENPALTFATINHDDVHVQVWAVEVDDWAAFGRQRQLDETSVPGDWAELLTDETFVVDAAQDRLVESSLDLGDQLAEHDGPLIVRVEPTEPYPRDSELWYQNWPSVAWVQRTTIGLDAVTDGEQLLVWATDLRTGEPLEGVTVEALGRDALTVTTDASGLATVDLSSSPVTGLVATADGEQAFLPADYYGYEGSGWTRSPRQDQQRWYGITDRGVYRPTETVNVKGWVRTFTGDSAELQLVDGERELQYAAYDAFGNEVSTGTAELTSLGGYDLAFDVPAEANLGEGYVEVWQDRNRGSAYIPFQVQEFRTPEFEVVARNESSGPYVAAEPATVAVSATYFAGGGLPNAPVNWTVTTQDTTYSPPNWDDFTFGVYQPWWLEYGYGFEDVEAGYSEDCCFPAVEAEVEQFSGVTDASGTHYLQMDFDGPDVDLPTTVTAEVAVEDVNRQVWADSTSLLVHAARLYVGLRSTRSFVEQGTPFDIEAVVTDIDGAAAAGRALTVEASRIEWTTVEGEWTEQLVDTQTCEVTTATEAVTCTFDTELGGEYRITSVVNDDDAHRNRTQLPVYVSGGDSRPTRGIELQQADLIPDAEEYAPGDSAEVLVRSPFTPATGLLTVTHNGLVRTETFAIEDNTAVLRIPIDEGSVPNVNLQVEVVGATPRTADDGTPLPDAPLRPAYATGRITLPVPPVTRTLDVVATPAADAVAPGEDTSVAVTVTGPDGAPVEGAELAVVVVDEAVLGLTDYQLASPLDAFYQQIYDEAYGLYGRESIVLNRPQDLGVAEGGGDGAAPEATEEATEAPAEEAEAPADGDLALEDGAGGADFRPVWGDIPVGEGGGTVEPIDLRTDFDALAVFEPNVTTDASGSATIDVPLPDSLTRYRIMVVAADGADRFGSGEANLTARLPLQARLSAPRFLNFGDEFQLPVVIQNQTDAAMDVEVAVDGSNLAFTEGAGRLVTVPANDRVEVRFPASAESAGQATVRVAAVSGDLADASSVELPVYTPATTEAFATYGVVDDGAVLQPVVAPTGVFPQFGQLSVDTSATALQALTDAVIYLDDYPYQSADAYASRILAVAALRDVLEAFSAPGLPAPERLDAQVQSDIDGLVRLQDANTGGFYVWDRLYPPDPYVSIQATHALVAAEAAGYDVPTNNRDLALGYLRDIESYIPPDWGQATKDSLSAYALNVRGLAGDRDGAKAAALYERAGDTLELDALAWLWPVLDEGPLDAEVERIFLNKAVDTPGSATFAVDYGEDAYLVLASDRRTDGIVLDALVQRAPESDLIPKVVNGLLGARVDGRWGNVQENTFILLGLKRYFDTFEAETPDFTAGVWLGDLYAGEHVYAGRTTDRGQTNVSMAELIEAGDAGLTIGKDGTGRLYYRIGLTYAPDDLELAARDEGFVVDRVYEAVDDPDDVQFVDGVWRIRSGAQVRVRLTMVADSQRTNVALVDNLPAGFEVVNPAFAVSPPIPPDPEGGDDPVPLYDYWWGPWFEHQNLGTDRVEAISGYLNGGTYEYTYIARATTPGRFITPPARAEQIYEPEVFGRSGSTVVVVE